jgi:C-terminal processing protease CtpA/Prc
MKVLLGKETGIMKTSSYHKHVALGLVLLLPSLAGAQDEQRVRIEMERTVNGKTERVVKEFTAPNAAALQDSLLAITGTDGKESRPFLGVGLEGRSDQEKENGARVAHVTPGSPADKAGLQPGDLITEIGGKSITGPQGVTEAVRAHKPGDQLQLRWLRGDKSRDAEVILAARDAEQLHKHAWGMPMDTDMERTFGGAWPGLPGARAYLGVRPGEASAGEKAGKGALIGTVEEGSAASAMGIQEGDRITGLNGKEVKDFGALAEAVASQRPEDRVTVDLLRDGKNMKLEGTLGEREGDLAFGTMPPGRRSFRLDAPLAPQEGLQQQIQQLQEQVDQLRKQMEQLGDGTEKKP